MTITPKLHVDLPALGTSGPAHALVVDDDTDIRNLLSMTLTNAGYTVSTAGDGPSALAQINIRLPDFVVLDVAMPGMSGIEVCSALRANERTQLLPIVMLTARNHVMHESEGMMAGADLYLVKPFSPKALVQRIENLLTYSV